MDDHERELGNFLTDLLSNGIGPSVTPLNGSNDRYVTQWGTGTYVLFDAMRFILTCRHVIEDGGKEYGFFGSDHVVIAPDGIVTASSVDAAVINIPEFEWTKASHSARPVPFECFALKHDPVPKELFFVFGFGGENSRYFDKQLDVHGLGYLAQVEEAAADHEKYFYLKWNRSGTEVTESTTEEAAKYVKNENPGGMSGSLVWDTGWMRAISEDRDWSIHDVKVTGLLERWVEEDNTLEVRRIEDVRDWMIEKLRNGGRKA